MKPLLTPKTILKALPTVPTLSLSSPLPCSLAVPQTASTKLLPPPFYWNGSD